MDGRDGRPAPGERGLLRQRAGGQQRVTNVELFFDLVYVFAVTQLSHDLLSNLTVAGALRAGLLLVMVWLLWVYTTWVTNWLDPERIPVRLLLLGLMLVSLVMSAGLPQAFGDGRPADRRRVRRHAGRPQPVCGLGPARCRPAA